MKSTPFWSAVIMLLLPASIALAVELNMVVVTVYVAMHGLAALFILVQWMDPLEPLTPTVLVELIALYHHAHIVSLRPQLLNQISYMKSVDRYNGQW